jgi:hypothetical protein
MIRDSANENWIKKIKTCWFGSAKWFWLSTTFWRSFLPEGGE